MSAGRVAGKGRARDLPFAATIVAAGRRRCRLTALEAAAAAWCDDRAVAERPGQLVPPEPGIVAAWLKRLGVKVVEGTLELYQVGPLGVERRLEWRVEFDIRREHEVYLTAKEAAHILGYGNLRGHITIRRLIQAGFLAGFEADKEREYVYGKRGPRWNQSTRGRRWRIHPDDLARFLTDHPEQYDKARIRGNPWRAIAAEAHRKRRWYRVPEVAALLGCSPQNVRDMLRYGDIQGVLLRDRQSIAYYLRPDWVEDGRRALDSWGGARCISGRLGLARKYPERAARRARILAERVTLQAKHDADAKRLLCEVRDIAGRRRKAAEAAALARDLYPDDRTLFPEPERLPSRWRAAAAFLRRHPGDGWDEAAD